jgi:hypothetical protein
MTNTQLIPTEIREGHWKLAKKRVDTKLGMLKQEGHVRADAITFSKNQLDMMERQIYDVLYSNPRDAFQFLPMNTGVPDGYTEYSYREISKLGAAKVVADGATDRPLVDADLTKTTVDIFEFGSGYTFTVGDSARSGAILDFNYVMEKARFAAESIALAHNEFALVGGSGVTGGPSAVTGFLNNATVVSNKPTLTDNDWTTVTGAGAYNTIRDMIVDVNAGSSGVHNATDVILSTFCYNLVSGTLLDSSGSSQTVLSALRQNYPEITFRVSASCNGRGTGGIDRCVAYERSATNAEYVASVVYDESVPINSGFRWTVHSRGRAAGCVVRRPLSIVYGDITVA